MASLSNKPKKVASLYDQSGGVALEILEALIPRLGVAPEGWLRAGGLLGAGMALRWLARQPGGRRLVGDTLVGVGLLTAYAYRDPERDLFDTAPDFIYAPADGRILSLTELEVGPEFIGGPAFRLDIASHFLDVPMLRAPMAGRVQFIHNPPGISAGSLGIETRAGLRLLLELRPDVSNSLRLPAPIAGRPLSLRPQAGQMVASIEKIGVRGLGIPILTSLYFPSESTYLLCKIGEPIQAGMTLVGRLKPELVNTEAMR